MNPEQGTSALSASRQLRVGSREVGPEGSLRRREERDREDAKWPEGVSKAGGGGSHLKCTVAGRTFSVLFRFWRKIS